MSHWITLHPESGIHIKLKTASISQLHLQPRSSSDEMLGVIKAIAELKPSGSFIFHTAVLFSFVQNLYKLFCSATFLLLGRQPLVLKTPIFGPFKNQYKYIFQLKVPIVFPFSVLFCEERPRFNL